MKQWITIDNGKEIKQHLFYKDNISLCGTIIKHKHDVFVVGINEPKKLNACQICNHVYNEQQKKSMETPEKELIKKVFDFMLMVVEINGNSVEKNNAVMRQDFELASELRKKGEELAKQLPTIDSMKALRAKLDEI